MHCERCRGLMVADRFTDLLDETGQITFGGWRCISCGEIVDPVIVTNRMRTHEPSSKPQHARLLTWVGQSA
ncbi:MAG: hypothetical protein HY207_04000 [Nitrospirae bacterium]|nr:hypothetical protein [Nitrospirota bacterium]